jgi:hypothetical protein
MLGFPIPHDRSCRVSIKLFHFCEKNPSAIVTIIMLLGPQIKHYTKKKLFFGLGPALPGACSEQGLFVIFF